MPLDSQIAMNFRLPQAETPFQSLGGMLTLRSELMKQDEAQRAIQTRKAFETEVAALPEEQRTPENFQRIAYKYAGAKDLIQSGDRQAQIEAAKQTRLMAIEQRQRMDNARIADMFNKTQDRNVRTKLLEIKALSDAHAQKARLAALKTGTDYNFGGNLDIGGAPDVTGMLMQLMHGQGQPQEAPQAPQAPQQGPIETSMGYGDAMTSFAGRPPGSPPLRVNLTPEDPGPVMTPQAAPQLVQPQPDNLDARDLRARQQGQGVPVARGVTEAQVVPQMPPEIAALPPRARQQWLLNQTKPSIAGAGNFTPETLQFVARQYLTGDRQVVQGFARSATARIALQNAIVDEAQKQGMSPEQVAAQIASFAGTMAGSRTIGQRAANISLAATEAQEMLGIVKETSDKFARTNFVPWNMALRAYETNTGTPEIAEFGAAVNALVNVYARAINPTGVPTVSDKEHARAVLNTVQSPAQVDAVLGIIRRELEIAKKAPSSVQQSTTNRITGRSTAPPPPPGFKLD